MSSDDDAIAQFLETFKERDDLVAKWMKVFNERANLSNARTSDEEDREIFGQAFSGKIEDVLEVKHNNRSHLYLIIDGFSEESLNRLGYILNQNNILKHLNLHTRSTACDSSELWSGISLNTSISRLSVSGFRILPEHVLMLAPFLISNQSLEKLELTQGRLCSDAINILGAKLAQRSVDSLKELNISGSNIGDNDVDMICIAAKRCDSLISLDLSGSNLGRKAASSLAILIGANKSALENIDLSHNEFCIDGILILIDSLKTNVMLKTLNLRGNSAMNEIAVGNRVLQLVCNTSSVSEAANSNHTLSSLGYPFKASPFRQRDVGVDFVAAYLNVDDDKLARTSLRLNHGRERSSFKARRKVLWCHMRGDFNVGGGSIELNLMPRVIALVGYVHPCVAHCESCHEACAQLLQYHETATLPEQSALECLRLEAIYRIIRARPEVCFERRSVEEKLHACQRGLATINSEKERLAEENQRLRSRLLAMYALSVLVVGLVCFLKS